jgi:pimeloyl-ACP methyl ester carboxylesterase
VEIREWHVVISGFQQKSSTLNGTTKVWLDLIALTKDKPDVRVELLTWRDDVENMAELISRLSPELESPAVYVYGYSWGGQTALNFAQALRRRSIRVMHMVLADPVYRAARFLFFFWLFQWRAFAGFVFLRVPTTVREVTWFRQREDYPRGHDLKADNDGLTIIHDAVELTTGHAWMDDHVDFRKACRGVCQAAGKGEF